mgnify:CR=1 FL=1
MTLRLTLLVLDSPAELRGGGGASRCNGNGRFEVKEWRVIRNLERKFTQKQNGREDLVMLEYNYSMDTSYIDQIYSSNCLHRSDI